MNIKQDRGVGFFVIQEAQTSDFVSASFFTFEAE